MFIIIKLHQRRQVQALLRVEFAVLKVLVRSKFWIKVLYVLRMFFFSIFFFHLNPLKRYRDLRGVVT